MKTHTIDILYFSRHTLNRSSTNSAFFRAMRGCGLSLIYLSTYGDLIENSLSFEFQEEKSFKVLSHKNSVNKLMNYFYCIAVLFYNIIKYKPKVVIFHDSVYAPVLILLKLLFRIRIGIHFHEIIWDCGYGRIINAVLKFQEKFILPYLSVAIFPSQRRKEITMHNFNVNDISFVFPNYTRIETSVVDFPRNSNDKIIYFGAVNNFILSDIKQAINSIVKLGYEVDIFAFGSKLNDLKDHFINNQSVKFFEPVTRSSILDLLPHYLASICVYSASNLNNILCEPRKMYDSVLSGVPVLVNEIEPPSLVGSGVFKIHDLIDLDLKKAKQNLNLNMLDIISSMNLHIYDSTNLLYSHFHKILCATKN